MSWFARRAFEIKEAALRRGTMALLPETIAFQRLSRHEIERNTWAKLRDVVRFASIHVPAYQRLWADVDLDVALASPEAFAELPIFERADVNAAGRDMIAPDLPGYVERATTSGSSGDRLAIWTDRVRAGWSMAARIRALRWWGLDYGARTVRMHARPFLAGASQRAALMHRALVASNRFTGTTRLSAFDMTREDMADHVKRLISIDPELICGYGGSLQRLAEHMHRQATPLQKGRLRAVIYGSEPVTGDSREVMARMFGVPIAMEYLCREFGLVAHECPHGNLHISEDNVFLEVIDEGGQPVVGQVGHVILTDLRPSRTPFVRYWLGDLAELAPLDYVCPCGCNLRVLRRLAGRSHEMIPLREGGAVPSYVFDWLNVAVGPVRHSQVRIRGDRLRLLIEVPPERLAVKHDMMLAWLDARLNHEYRITLETVDHIAPEPSGKYAQIVFEGEPTPSDKGVTG